MNINHSGQSFETAEAIAIKALGYLSSDTDLMGRFLSLSGLDTSDLRAVASEPSFLAAILDFILTDDSLVLAFTSNNGLAPEDVVIAKAKLDPMSMASTGAY
ncbi:DUF3572 domain-containing protein [Cohaesibacter celericrescens]|uniref:DUF3572 domain-containing protein n=1 Tax=Cohaesibacter celericrescens TaxID=2067669 RepID=A0A2N5XS10_9HYPH|nr:DUF3572 domain-containing protein [Cohaesibacter celericrescens]PLW77303.1 DUF3572 domain-containing protein [Cohaesibacter celericrescens]